MKSIVKLSTGEVFNLTNYGIGIEPMRDVVRDVIALYLTGITSDQAVSTFVDGVSFIIESTYDEGDLGYVPGSTDTNNNYSSYVIAGPIIDKGNGEIIVKMGKPMTESEKAIQASAMERQISALNSQLAQMNKKLSDAVKQKSNLELENFRIRQEFEALRDMINAVGSAVPVIPSGEPIGDPDDLYPPDMPADSIEKDEDPTYPVEEPDPVFEEPPVVEEKPKKKKKVVEKKVYEAPKTTKTKKTTTEKKPSKSKKKNAF